MAQIRPLTEELQRVAVEQLGENPTCIPADLEALKTWIKQQPHLRANTDDQFLVAFLRGCKYSMEKAKSKIDKFFTLKGKYPEFFGLSDVNDPKEAVPLNLQATHFINTGSYFTTLYNIAKLFMPTSMQNRTHVHGADREQLYKFIPKEILPLEYGGKNTTLQHLINQWEEKVLSYADYFNDNETYGVDEKLRVKVTEVSRSKFLGIF